MNLRTTVLVTALVAALASLALVASRLTPSPRGDPPRDSLVVFSPLVALPLLHLLSAR
jgi:hypothetical protein